MGKSNKNKKISNKKTKKEEVTLENYNSLNDYLFYKYFCEKGNEKLQKAFIESLGIPVKDDLTVLSEIKPPDLINKKKIILDLVAESEDTLFNVEMQEQKKMDFKERMFFYENQLVRLNKGLKYDKYKKVVLIIIINFKLNDLQRYKHTYKLINSNDLTDIFTDKIQIIAIELKKFRKIKKDLNNKKHLYLSFIDKKTNHKQRKELAKMDEGLKTAIENIEKVFQNEEQLRVYQIMEYNKLAEEKEKQRIEERIKKERKKGIKIGKKEGREEGIEEGKEEEKIETAIQLKKIGLEIEDIAKVTKLNIDFIKKL